MSGNTLRGTPNRGQSRGGIPFNNNSPSATGAPHGPPHAAAASSGIPRPVLETQATQSEVGGAGMSASRQKQSKRDENPHRNMGNLTYHELERARLLNNMDTDYYVKAIRKKMESDLSKKKHLTSRARHSRKAPPGTVLALKPSPALQIKPATTVAEAAQLMAAKREDCVLVTDDDDRIAGIFTAKDLAFRVVGAGQKPNHITIAEIMTKNPLCARTDTSATDALDLMVRKGFRHLPVMDENQDISGILDITKCFYDAMEKLERAYSSSRRLYDALEGVQSELGTSQPQQIIQYVEALRSKMSGPTLESVLDGRPPTTVSVRTSVKEAAQQMKENRTTAVLVQDQGAITGIFTSKDVVLRVIAPGLDPATCSVVRVMTPHPDFAPMDMSIQAALRKMHDGHYLNLPVMTSDGGEIVGMVDVLKLTYATLEQINTMSTSDSEGPAWNKFWLSLDDGTESMMSGEGSHTHHTNLGSRIMSPDMTRERIGDSVAPGDSASHVGIESPPHSIVTGHSPIQQSPAELPFPFKFKAPSGRVHRLQVIASQGIGAMVSNVISKLGNEVDAIGGAPAVEEGRISGGFALSYLDDEGDSVSITTDNDLLESILLARQGRREKVDLFVHDPEKPPVAASLPVEPLALPTPPISATPDLRQRRRYDDEDDDAEDEDDDISHVRRSRRSRSTPHEPEQVIQGVPNELLLPGAIVTLAVVIVGVFTISRLTTRDCSITSRPPPQPPTMIVRSIAARHGPRALTPVVRSCHRTIRTESLTGELSQESIEAFTARAANKAGRDLTDEQRAQVKALETLPQAHRRFKKLQRQTHHIGSAVNSGYIPSQLIKDPPSPKDITLELLMASQTHMGHHTSLWNPANARYIYGARQGIHLISLEVTAAHLRRAARVVEEVAYRGGLILFVGTRKGQMDIVTKAAKLAGGCHLFSKWTPGNITNRDIINRGKEIKVVDEQDAVLKGFERFQRTARPLLPDLVVCLNPLENYTMLYECGLANIPTIGVIDTNASPDWVTYTIPANDDSYRSIAVISGVLGRAGEQGQKRRLADAENGVVAWHSPTDTHRFISNAKEKWRMERKRWAHDHAGTEREGGGGGEAALLEMVQAQREQAMFGDAALEEEVQQEIEAAKMAEGAANWELRKQLLEQ
ncbi:hypothetical protein CkaCkLH20_09717 [Colletotrichum karsti]|uniref:Meiotically up-regulated gene 70 protein n=1 Tax=Colletotrichum karsti TaxID=1095194 RepID=A0A9P6HYE0_9PEZI|nr:uncharacterized protein CkaCkLH20_09717 [Colletotrichum karsti]KAF9872854.1 hypothetical protein CkaCkLH20_09717 [Colletotrichum karsti]